MYSKASRLSILWGPPHCKSEKKMRINGVMFIVPSTARAVYGLSEVAALSLVYKDEMLTHNF